ncbi:M23 family metallopeptidase [Sinomonas sp. ASV486]|uniref:M23 family metallopeptidase n=1 Tax=Sinomonas sp. ASV486 TaxID=3051170 RepID=UPI0027DE2CD4|nr:M23 family metallopeptidase [Sinomonas sp. ASV486]MDQ4490450.1 M23 family metallopeptidase [Sinomonas sp. ASV486]
MTPRMPLTGREPLRILTAVPSVCALALSAAVGGPAAAQAPPAAQVALAQPVGASPTLPRPAGAQPSGYGWAWPLEPRPAVVRQFDPPRRPWLSGHRGADLGAVRGAEVRSPQAGTVVFSGWVVDRPVVTIDHGDGLRSSFEPVVGTATVGAAIARGEPVGALAPGEAGHCGPDDCLHWGVRRGDEYVDPLAFIEDRRPSVLLPWG